MSLTKKRKNEELKYLDKYVWLWGRWWERTIDLNGPKIEGLRPVAEEDLDTIPPRYYEYYQQLDNN